MWRRVYVVFPYAGQARRIVAELGTVVVGKCFAVELPHGHLGDVRVPLARGEVVLLVDVPHQRVRAIEALIGHQPEASIGGVGWTIVAAGI